MTSNTEALFETLHANGYTPSLATIDGASCVQVDGSTFHYLVTDHATDTRRYFRDAMPSLVVLSLETRNGHLPALESDPRTALAQKFADELVKLLAPADKFLRKYVRPLVRTTPTGIYCLYQSDVSRVGLFDDLNTRLFQYGLTTPDMGAFATLYLEATCMSVPVEGGTWLADRSPLNTPRAELPQWNPDEITPKVCALVDRLAAAGELRERGPYKAPAPAPAFTYGDLDISADPRSWCPDDPRHTIPGVADEVRRLRAERGMKPWD